MVNGQSPVLIFMHDSKGRTRYRGVALQPCDEALREQGLTAAEVAFERQYRTGHKILRDLPRDCFRFSGVVGNERIQEVICDLRLESPAVASHPLRAICDSGSRFASTVTLEIFAAILAQENFCCAAI